MDYNDKTVMEQWAEASLEYSESQSKLLNEFGFRSQYLVKEAIKLVFPEAYLKRYYKMSGHGPHWLNDVAINTAKAILCASAVLETVDLTKIIKWGNS